MCLVGLNRRCGGGIRLVVDICGDGDAGYLTQVFRLGPGIVGVGGGAAGLDQRLAVGAVLFVEVDEETTVEAPPSLTTPSPVLQLSTLFRAGATGRKVVLLTALGVPARDTTPGSCNGYLGIYCFISFIHTQSIDGG